MGNGLAALGETPANDVPAVMRVASLVRGDLLEDGLDGGSLAAARELRDDACGDALVQGAIDERVDRELSERERPRA